MHTCFLRIIHKHMSYSIVGGRQRVHYLYRTYAYQYVIKNWSYMRICMFIIFAQFLLAVVWSVTSSPKNPTLLHICTSHLPYYTPSAPSCFPSHPSELHRFMLHRFMHTTQTCAHHHEPFTIPAVHCALHTHMHCPSNLGHLLFAALNLYTAQTLDSLSNKGSYIYTLDTTYRLLRYIAKRGGWGEKVQWFCAHGT